MKKLISMLMAGAMILALAVPAFATTAATYGSDAALADNVFTGSTTMDGATNGATIKISLPTVPSTGGFVMNPYKLSYTTAVQGVTLSGDAAKAQIVAPTYLIKSESNLPINVSVKATTKITSKNLKSLATAAVKAGDTGNNLFLQLLMAPTTTNDMEQAITSTSTGVKTLTLKAGDVTVDAKQQPQIAAATFNTSTPPACTAPAFLGFTFTGSASDSALLPWTSADKVAVTLAWTFIPVAPSAS